ncbi:AEC family transporter [Nigerium massiliense]|uniref:AEC family transporter n=1 Tax=Nigerium massiliense TaxID=1522317 RepID=UPI0005916E02|nr:hypothetical protein [Nigerium massiliense]
MGEVFVRAAVLIAIIGMGYGIKRLGWVSLDDFPTISRVVLRITLPCALITSFNEFHLTPGLLLLCVIGAAAVLSQQVAVGALERRRGRPAQAFGVINVPNYNIGLFAMPYVATFAGPQAIVLTALFDLGNSLVSAGIGYGWGLMWARPQLRVTVAKFVRQVFSSAVFDTYLALLILRLLDVALPPPVIAFTSTVGGANTFLAMLMIGIGLEVVLSPAKYATAARYLGYRYGFALLFALVVWFALPLDAPVKVVLCMVFFAPMAAMVTGFTGEAGLDVEVSAFMTSLTTLVAVVAMPAIFLVLSP